MVIEPEFSRLIPLSEIGVGAVERQIRANTEELAALAKRFELPSIEKLEAKLAVRRDGEAILVEGGMAASVTQSCVITGDPVAAGIDEPMLIRFVREPEYAPDSEIELETEDCDSMFHDGKTIDLGEAAAQSLLLALNPFPRGPDAETFMKEAGVKDESEAGPFGALAALKDKLGKS